MPPSTSVSFLCSTGQDLLDRLGADQSARKNKTVSALCYSPIRRELEVRKEKRILLFNRSSHYLAALIQATGLEHRPPCTQCLRENGPWKQCVVPSTSVGGTLNSGACANCKWNGNGPRCSLHTAFVPEARHNDTLAHAGVASSTLASGPFLTIPALGGYPSELASLGNPGIADRVSTSSRMTGPELRRLYDETCHQLETLHVSFYHLLEEIHSLGQQKSELYMQLALLRTFNHCQVLEGGPAINVGEPSTPQDSIMPAGQS
ncbi:hypothetical protein F4810DRAFT_572780 [Camillea tinctor]|nr:hypothetical protein F4810DRAFT_572780 [Camillea tinctor]